MAESSEPTILTISISFADREDGKLRTVGWACAKEMSRMEFHAAANAVEAALQEAGWPRSIPIETREQPLPAGARVQRH